MTSLATLCVLLLSTVFVWSAVAKLRRPAPTAAAFGQLGVPLPRLSARLVPVAELALAGLLATNAKFGSALSIIVLIVFTLILLPAAVAFTHTARDGNGTEPGRAVVSCGCFGSASTEPISWVEVGRNLVLIAVAVVAALRGPTSLGTALADVSLPDLIAFSTAGVIAAVALQLVALKRDIGAIWRADLAGEADHYTHDHFTHDSSTHNSSTHDPVFPGGLHA